MNAAQAISLLIELLKQASAISALVKQAQDANRDITIDELKALMERDDVARARLILAIDAAKAEGR